MTHLPARILLVLAAVVAHGCGRAAAPEAAGRPPLAVEVTAATTIDLEQTVEVVGTLAAVREADVRSEYSGTVAEIFVTQWVKVRAGTPLARLESREVEAGVQAARAAALQAEAAGARAGRELTRSVQLEAAGLATRQSVDEASTVDEAARAALAAARAQLEMAEARLAKALLRAPIDGIVAQRNVGVGDYVENMGNPPPMFRIVDNRQLELTATVPTARLAELAVGQRVAFAADALPGRELAGTVAFINPAADEASRTVRVKVEVPNPDEALKSGLFVKGRIVTGNRPGVVVVPRPALVSWDTAARTATLFVVEGDRARRVEVETGSAAGDHVEVVRGLAAGQPVVTRGGFNLRDGDRVAVAAGA